MTKAFETPGESISTWRTIGEVYEVKDDTLSGIIEDEEGDQILIRIPFKNILESERPRAVRGIMFFCDLEVVPAGEIGSIQGIEFSDQLTERVNDRRDEIFDALLERATQRVITEE